MSKQDVIEIEGIVKGRVAERTRDISCYFRQTENELHSHIAGR